MEFFQIYTPYIFVLPPCIFLPADPSIPAQSRLGEGPNHLLIHHSAFEPSVFWAEKKGAALFSLFLRTPGALNW